MPIIVAEHLAITMARIDSSKIYVKDDRGTRNGGESNATPPYFINNETALLT